MKLHKMAENAERTAAALDRASGAANATVEGVDRVADATARAADEAERFVSPQGATASKLGPNQIGGPVTQGLTPQAAAAARAAFHRGGGGASTSSGGSSRGSFRRRDDAGANSGSGLTWNMDTTPQHLLPGWQSPLPIDPAAAAAPVAKAVAASGSAVVNEIRALRADLKQQAAGQRLASWRAQGGEF